jgi:hypothetical protein
LAAQGLQGLQGLHGFALAQGLHGLQALQAAKTIGASPAETAVGRMAPPAAIVTTLTAIMVSLSIASILL